MRLGRRARARAIAADRPVVAGEIRDLSAHGYGPKAHSVPRPLYRRAVIAFGSWEAAVDAAGVRPLRRSRSSSRAA